MVATPRVGLVMRTLADPTRLAIYERIAAHGESSVVELTRHARVSQPAVSQHLKALTEVHLVAARREGRNTYYRALPQGLAPLASWIEQCAAMWDTRFDRLDDYLRELQRNEKKRARPC